MHAHDEPDDGDKTAQTGIGVRVTFIVIYCIGRLPLFALRFYRFYGKNTEKEVLDYVTYVSLRYPRKDISNRRKNNLLI